MTAVHVNLQGATLHKEHNRLLVCKDNEVLRRYPAHHVEEVCLYGYIQITTQAARFLMKQGVDVAFFTLQGRFLGFLYAARSTAHAILRVAQHHRFADHGYRLAFAQEIVRAKLETQYELLYQTHRNRADVDLTRHLVALQELRPVLDQAQSLDVLRGYEGAATRLYFDAMSLIVLPPFFFQGRNRRPPRDPVNALLSLAYTFLSQQLTGLLEAKGFESFLGMFHGVRAGRASLALDLIEEFRHSAVDRFVLSLLNRRQIKPDDFTHSDERGTFLVKQAFDRFLSLWSDYKRKPTGRAQCSLEERMRAQVSELREAFIHGRTYQPHTIREY